MLRESENVAAESDGLPPLGTGSDRQAAHYYRSMHARAVQREQRWKQRALAAEQIIKQLLVFLGFFVEKIGKLTRQVAWFNKQHFGRKSEATRPAQPATPSASEGAKEGAEQAPAPGKRKPGQQPGAKGPKRRLRPNLPVEPIDHRLSEQERTCPICHKIHPEIGVTEDIADKPGRRLEEDCFGSLCPVHIFDIDAEVINNCDFHDSPRRPRPLTGVGGRVIRADGEMPSNKQHIQGRE